MESEIEAVLSRRTTRVQNLCVGEHISLVELCRAFDAVLLTTGRGDNAWLSECGVRTTASGIAVNTESRMTSRTGVFAAGNAVRHYKLVVQSVAEGKLAAECINAWLREQPFPKRHHAFETRLTHMSASELCEFCSDYPTEPRLGNAPDVSQVSEDQIRQEALRCLHCDCPALENCQLHHYAALYECDARRFHGDGRRYEGKIADDAIVLESGKCILCGICINITRDTPDAAGLAFLGRSTDSRIGPAEECTLSRRWDRLPSFVSRLVQRAHLPCGDNRRSISPRLRQTNKLSRILDANQVTHASDTRTTCCHILSKLLRMK